MIYGIGTDICSIRGFERSYLKRGNLFASEFCNSNELKQVKGARSPAIHLAKIFCAKECVGKAVGTGLVPEFWWDDIEVLVTKQKTDVLLSDAGIEHMSTMLNLTDPWKTHISLSNTDLMVSGICIVSAS